MKQLDEGIADALVPEGKGKLTNQQPPHVDAHLWPCGCATITVEAAGFSQRAWRCNCKIGG